jgi:hypothetical protein
MVLITGRRKSEWKRAQVRAVSVERRLYLVSSSEPGTYYPVRLMVSTLGKPLGECGCPAGQMDRECRHIVAAGLLAQGIKRMRRGVE